jgi:colicin import membrane protein
LKRIQVNAKATPHLEFAPPEQPGMGRAWVVAGVAHALLFLALGLATAWKTQPQTLQAEAELWSAVPQAAAPRLQEPLPKPEPVPEPVPETRPTPPAKPTTPPPPAPDPAVELKDAQIALEKKKQEEKKKEADKLKAEKIKADKEKAIREKAAKEKLEKAKAEKVKAEKDKAEKAKLEKEKLAKEKKALEEKERDKKKAAEKEKLEAAESEARRKETISRNLAMAGASGGDNATGTALKSSGPTGSTEYKARIATRIKNNITYLGDRTSNVYVLVEVRVNSDGTIRSRKIETPSGNKAWDEAVLRAIDKTEVLPKDTDGRVPPVIQLVFRPLD